jgi:hypothetical protein
MYNTAVRTSYSRLAQVDDPNELSWVSCIYCLVVSLQAYRRLAIRGLKHSKNELLQAFGCSRRATRLHQETAIDHYFILVESYWYTIANAVI